MELTNLYKKYVNITSMEGSPFHESKYVINGYNVSIFNYRLASYSDFLIEGAKELRGVTFIFNMDGSIFERYLLLDKFFNLNQVEETNYSIVKNYKIKSISNKEDGSVLSFVKFPNGDVLAKTKMSFENDQALASNRIYNTNSDIKRLVDWSLDNNIVAVFEYVSPFNRIVLNYKSEDLILLKLRDNKTGKYLDLNDYTDIIGNVKIAKFEEVVDLDTLIEKVTNAEDIEGVVVNAIDLNGNNFFYKMKSKWYFDRHFLYMESFTRENIIISLILDDTIDDILGQLDKDEVEIRNRINNISSFVRKSISNKMKEIEDFYKIYLEVGSDKEFALKYRKDENFGFVMAHAKSNKLKKLSKEEALNIYKDFSKYENAIKNGDLYEMASRWVREKTYKLESARYFLNN